MCPHSASCSVVSCSLSKRGYNLHTLGKGSMAGKEADEELDEEEYEDDGEEEEEHEQEGGG